MFTEPFLVGQTVTALGKPVKADGSPSPATLSNTVYSSSDPTVFTVAPDPATPGGAIITAVGAGTATLSETATATEPDGVTTETISGTDTITVSAAPPPPPAPAASIVFTFGTPSGPGAAAPAASGTAGVDKAHS